MECAQTWRAGHRSYPIETYKHLKEPTGVNAQKPMSMPPPLVSVLTVKAENAPIYTEFAAQTYARDLVEVRGRVDGYIDEPENFICDV